MHVFTEITLILIHENITKRLLHFSYIFFNIMSKYIFESNDSKAVLHFSNCTENIATKIYFMIIHFRRKRIHFLSWNNYYRCIFYHKLGFDSSKHNYKNIIYLFTSVIFFSLT